MQDLPNQIKTISTIKDLVKQERGGNVINICISGSWLYGFASEDSDIDYRGCYITSTDKLLGLNRPRDMIERTVDNNDIVLNELQKEIGLLVAGNCNTYEALFAPQIYNTKEYFKLQNIADMAFAKDGIYNSYRGMAYFNYKKFVLNGRNTVKKYLYVIRALMAGMYALERRQIQPNLVELNKVYQFQVVNELIDLKQRGRDLDNVSSLKEEGIQKLINDLFASIDECYKQSVLSEKPTKEHLRYINEHLLKIRRNYLEKLE